MSDEITTKKESALTAKSEVNSTDFLRLIGSNGVSYKNLVTDVARYIMENYAGTTLAGSSQTPKAAIDALKAKNDSQDASITSLNGNFGGFKFHYLSQNVSIPANSYLEIDISSISVSPFIMSAFLGPYMLPYSEGGVVKTWVYTVTGGKIRIQNNTTAWTNFAFSVVIASR